MQRQTLSQANVKNFLANSKEYHRLKNCIDKLQDVHSNDSDIGPITIELKGASAKLIENATNFKSIYLGINAAHFVPEICFPPYVHDILEKLQKQSIDFHVHELSNPADELIVSLILFSRALLPYYQAEVQAEKLAVSEFYAKHVNIIQKLKMTAYDERSHNLIAKIDGAKNFDSLLQLTESVNYEKDPAVAHYFGENRFSASMAKACLWMASAVFDNTSVISNELRFATQLRALREATINWMSQSKSVQANDTNFRM